MSLARRKRDRILAAQTIIAAQTIHASVASVRGAALASAAALSPAAGANSSPADRAASQITLRLTHDLRRLKEIRSIDKKVAAKREMLPEYKAWVDGIMSADAGVGNGLAADVVPTYMVWLLDTEAYMPALDVAEFLLRHRVEMPKRYARDVPTIVVELVADAAAKAQNAGQSFDPAVLDTAEHLTAGCDIHDEVRAKLLKAIGVEQLRKAEDMPADDSRIVLESTLVHLREAQRLNDRVGVKDRIKRAEKLLAAVTPPASESNIEQSGTAA
jgi:hypothetical protein